MVYSWKDGLPSGDAARENTNDPLATLTAVDGVVAAFSYSLSGTDKGLFEIDDNGVLSLKSALDYEALDYRSNRQFSVVVSAHSEDGTKQEERTFVLTLQNVNDVGIEWRDDGGYNPDGKALSENNSEGVLIASFRATDGDSDATVNYSLSGADENYFNIDSNGRLYFASRLDYEDANHVGNLYSVAVVVDSTDGSPAISQLYVLTVNNVNEFATEWDDGGSFNIDGGGINENNDAGFGIEIFRATDGDKVDVTYSLQAGGDSDYFGLDESNGVARLYAKSSFDHEDSDHAVPQYSVVVVANSVDGSPAISQLYVLTVNNVNEFPTIWEVGGNPTGGNILEDSGIGVSLADFGAVDGDGIAVTYGLGGGDDASYFIIDEETGVLTTKQDFNFESRDHYTVEIRAGSEDSNDGSDQLKQLFVLTVGNVNENANDLDWASTGNPDGATINENNSVGISLGDFNNSNIPAGASVTYGLAGEDAHYFDIGSNTGWFSAVSTFDYENQDVADRDYRYSVVVVAGTTDDTTPISRLFVLTIGDVSNTPDWASNIDTGITRNENGNNTTLWDFRNDSPLPDGVSITYGLSGDHADRFTISPRDGGDFWRFRGGGGYDYESEDGQAINNRYSVIITANATEEGTAISRTYILTIGDVTSNNTHDWNSNTSTGHGFNENNRPSGLFNFDNDGSLPNGVAITYEISDENKTYFDIDTNSGLLSVKGKLDYESDYGQSIDNRYSVIVTANATEEGTAISRVYILTIGDVNNTNDWNSNTSTGHGFNENNRPSGLFNFDNDGHLPAGVAMTYGISDENKTYFSIDPNSGLLSVKGKLDYESEHGQSIDNRYSVIITANATEEGTAISRVYILTIGDVNNTHDWNSNTLTGKAIDENREAGLNLWHFRNDGHLQAGITMTYAISGDAADYFTITDDVNAFGNFGRLRAKSSFDYESDYGQSIDNRYSVVITANADFEGTEISRLFILTINDVNNTPGWNSDTPTGKAIDENNGTESLWTFDNDGAPRYVDITYGISGENTKYFGINTRSGFLRVKAGLDYESDYGQSIDNRYSVIVTANATEEGTEISRVFVLTIGDVDYTPVWEDLARPWRVFDSGNNRIENRGVGGAPLADFNTVTNLPDQYQITYGLSSEGLEFDNTKFFKINRKSGVLVERASFDYESAHGQLINNRYTVVVTANANGGGESDQISRLFILTIDDQNYTARWDGPPSKGAYILENNSTGVQVADFDNPSPLRWIPTTYGLSGDDAKYFNIHEANGRLTVRSVLDYESERGQENNNRYSIVVVANAKNTKEGTQLTHLFILTVGDVNNTPDWASDTTTGKTLNENRKASIAVAHFDSNGPLPDGVSMTYAITGGDTDYFDISPRDGGRWRLSATSSFDYESDYGQSINNRYSVIITANATEEGTAISRTYILTIGDVSNTPDWNSDTPTGKAIDENNGTESLWTFDNDGAPRYVDITYGISGENTTYFGINTRSGFLSVKAGLDYESDYGQSIDNRYSVIVTANATSGATSGEAAAISRTYILTVNDVGNTPDWNSDTPTGKAIDENNGTESLWTFDNDGAPRYVDITYGISGENTTYFGINTRSGFLRVKAGLDYESDYGQSIDNRYSVIVTANTTSGEALAISRTYILTINNIDNNGGWNYDYDNNPAGKSIEENSPSNYYMGTFQINSSEGTTYSLMGENADNGYFKLEEHHSNPDIVHLITNSVFDYETEYGRRRDNRYSVVVVANAAEEGTAISRTFILTIGDYSNVPYWGVEYKRAIVIENNNPSTLLVDLYNFDEYHNTSGVPEGVFVTYGLWGDNAQYFSVTPNEGHLSTKVSFDYESEYGQSIDNNYTITIIANKTKPPKDGRGGEGDALNETFVLRVFNDPRDDVDNSSATTKSAPAPVAGLNGKVLFDGDADNIGGISDGIGNEGLIIIGDDLVATQYSDGAETNLVINNVENFEQSFVGYTDADGNDQNHWFFVRDDAGDNTGHIVFDADGLDVNLESLSSGGATTTPDQINLLAGLNFGSDGDFNKPDDLTLDLNGNNAASLTHDQFLALIGGSNNIDFI